MIRESKGNMYEFITHTWNPIKGECQHDCSYCYMKRWGNLNPVRLDEKDFRTDIGEGNFIFIGSGTDMFAPDIPDEWISKVINKCYEHNKNRYLFQSKNPDKMLDYFYTMESKFCITLESNIHYKEIMRNSPTPINRVHAVSTRNIKIDYITIEPILKFDLRPFIDMIEKCEPGQVNIGADSGHNGLPEPSEEEIQNLIYWLEYAGIKVFKKKNLKRLTPNL